MQIEDDTVFRSSSQKRVSQCLAVATRLDFVVEVERGWEARRALRQVVVRREANGHSPRGESMSNNGVANVARVYDKG